MAGSESFRLGIRASVPALPTIFSIFLGFGLASQVAGVPALGAIAMTLAIYAAPALYAIIDLSGSGATVFQLIAIGVLVNLRFFVMSVTLSQMFKEIPTRRLLRWAYCIAATPFLLTFFQSRKQNAGNLFDYYRGISIAIFPAVILGAIAGISISGEMPPPFVFATALFMPIYFSLLLAAEVKRKHEIGAVALGFSLTPPLESLAPGWGLTLAALTAGVTMTVIKR